MRLATIIICLFFCLSNAGYAETQPEVRTSAWRLGLGVDFVSTYEVDQVHVKNYFSYGADLGWHYRSVALIGELRYYELSDAIGDFQTTTEYFHFLLWARYFREAWSPRVMAYAQLGVGQAQYKVKMSLAEENSRLRSDWQFVSGGGIGLTTPLAGGFGIDGGLRLLQLSSQPKPDLGVSLSLIKRL